MWYSDLTMKQINKPFLQDLRKDIEAALASVAAKHGISIKTGTCKFMPENAEMRLQIAVLNDEGAAETRELVSLKNFLARHSLTLEQAQKPIKYGYEGRTYIIVGYQPNKPKYSFLGRCQQDGKNYGLVHEGVLAALGLPSNAY